MNWKSYGKQIMVSGLIALLYMILVKKFFIISYAINDDINMKSIVSGAYTGMPDVHMIHITGIATLILKILYEVNQSLDWYGIFMLCIFGGVLWLICAKLILNEKQKFLPAVILSFTWLVLAQMVRVQYTTAGAVLGAGVLFCYLFGREDSSTSKIGFSAFLVGVGVLLTLSIRRDVALILIAYMVGAVIYKEARFSEKKIRYKNMLLCFGSIVTAVLICTGINSILYHTDDWKDFLEFNEEREALYDYGGLPDYDAEETIYQDMDITVDEYQALKDSNFLLTDNGREAVREIERQVSENNVIGSSINNVFQYLKTFIGSKELLPFHLLTVFLFVLTLTKALKIGNKKDIGFLGYVTIIFLLLNLYLGWMGRTPFRAVFSIYIMYIASISALWIQISGKSNRKSSLYLHLIFIAIIVLGVGATVFVIKEQEKENLSQWEMAEVVKNYFKAHPDNFYLIDTNTLSAFTGVMKLREDVEYQNYLRLGDWPSYSPLVDQKLQENQIEDIDEAIVDKENVYVVTNDDRDLAYLKNMSLEMGANYEIVDVIDYDEYHLYVYKYHKFTNKTLLPVQNIEKVLGHVNSPDSEKALDGDRGTKWTTGEPQKSGMAFDIYLKEPELLCGFRIDTATYEDHPRNLRVFISTDNVEWNEIEVTTDTMIEYYFDPQPVKYMRLLLGDTENTEWNWSISEIDLFVSEE